MKRMTLLLLNAYLMVSVATAQRVSYKDLNLIPTGKKTLGYKEMTAKVTLALDATGAEQLIIRTGPGTKKLLPAEDNQIRMEANIVFTVRKLKKVEKLIDRSMDLSLIETEAGIVLTSILDFEDNQKEFSTGGLLNAPNRRIDLTVYVPAGLTLDIKDKSGDLTMQGLHNDAKVVDGPGTLIIQQHVGALDVLDHSGVVRLSQVNWEQDGLHEVIIEDYSGSVYLEKVAGLISIEDYAGSISVRETKGELKLTDNAGTITITQHEGSSRVTDGSGRIYLSQLEGRITIEDTSGRISLEDVTDVNLRRHGSGKVHRKNVGSGG